MKNLILFLLVLSIIISTNAQESVLPSGGNALGAGGTVSYSIGQIFYTTSLGSAGFTTQGVQQPYEIFVVSGLEETQVDVTISAYPNPVVNFLTLRINNMEQQKLHYQLIDITGKTIKEQRITNQHTTINLSQISPTTLLLVVLNGGRNVKTFKIIKN